MSRPWFKFYTRDFRDGVRVLSLEEIGAYTLILSLIYETNGRLVNDERAICAQIGCDVRVWRRVSARLVAEGKITLTEEGCWTNERAQAEITSAELLAKKRQTSGRIGGQLSGKSRAKPLENKESDEANASSLLHTEYRRQKAEAPTDIKSVGVCDASEGFALKPDQPEPKPDKRGSRMRPDWRPSQDGMAYAEQNGLLNGWCEATIANFRDYWLGVPGAKGIKLDWDATWRTEVRKEAQAQRHKPRAPGAQAKRNGPYNANGVSRLAYG